MSDQHEPIDTSARWRRVEALYHEMRARPPDERASALAAACSDDPSLAAEVRSLLDQAEPPGGFLGGPAVDVAARLVSEAGSGLTGRRLGVFEIQGLLGAGGMGEVYRARDTRLGRSVAIKILPRAFKNDSDRRIRFEREARVLASLSHPGICALHDLGREGDTHFLVMELVEGETLAARLKKGALPLEQTLRIGIEVADALDRAHRQGVIHRDLKPGNVMLTRSGSKLMDFGLAKLTLAGQGADSISASPTASGPLTDGGMLMGTVPYMAPEQLEGKGPDARSDLWAFGCVLYEMATGRPAFDGTSRASLISAIMAAAPQPISQLQPLTPLPLERLVRVCLAKDPDDRLQTAHDVMQELKWIAEAPSTDSRAVNDGVAATAAGGRGRWIWSALVLSIGVFLGLVLVGRLPHPTPPATIQAILDVGPAEEVNSGDYPGYSVEEGGSRAALEWTPDGRSLVFVGRQAGVQRIYVRDLASETARPIEGTEGAESVTISPDGRSIAFAVGTSWDSFHVALTRVLRRVPINGGPPSMVAKVLDVIPPGVAWGTDGRLFYGPADCGRGLYVICAAASELEAVPITAHWPGAGDAVMHTLPHILPGGKALLYTVRQRAITWGDEQVVVHSFASGQAKVLLKDAADARYVGSGHLVFLRRGTLFGVGFDLARLEVTGAPVPLLDGVSQALRATNAVFNTGAGQFSVSSAGDLAWLRGTVAPFPDFAIFAIDRQSRVHPLNVQPPVFGAYLSPDGRQLAFTRPGLGEVSLWVHDLDRGTQTKLEGEGEQAWPLWTPNGKRVAFRSLNRGVGRIVWRQADGAGTSEPLAEDGAPSSWSPDGRELAFVKDGDIWIATLGSGTATTRALLASASVEEHPEFSPDGKWLMYESDTSGRTEVYVQPYPGPGPRKQVSLEGGASPAWNPAGGEIFFLSPEGGDKDMMSVDVSLGPMLRLGTPRRLLTFVGRGPNCIPVRCYGVSPDGRLFYYREGNRPWAPPAPRPRPPVTQIHLVTNWVEEMKAKVAAGQAK